MLITYSLHFYVCILVIDIFQDYAIETPLKKSDTVVEGGLNYEVKIDFRTDKDIAAINFVLKVCLNLQPFESFCHLLQTFDRICVSKTLLK